jgi:alpha-mannosidase
MRRGGRTLWFSVGAAVLAAFGARAQEPARVFQLGQFDRSSAEFRGGEPRIPVSVDATSPGAARQWFGSQPAVPQSGVASAAAQPRSVVFNLTDAPAAEYTLHLAVILETRAVPYLRIALNGKQGSAFLDSPLDAGLGTMDDSFQTTLVPADVRLAIPGTLLHRGANTLTIQVVQSEAPTGDPEGITWDALEMLAVAPEKTGSDAAIVPTIFYRTREGKLEEQVVVYAKASMTRGDRSVRLTLNGRPESADLSADGELGERRAVLWLPEFGAHAKAEVAEPGNSPLFAGEIDPAKKWTVLMVPQNHLDIGYSDYQPKVGAIQARMLDEAMDYAETTPSFRYSTDGFWNVEQFWQTRSAAERERLIHAVKNGTISIPAEYANLLTGFPTNETLIRSLYPSANFSREHGTPFEYADITDVPSYSWSYASVLASAGVPYFIAGPNGHATRAPALLQGRLNEESPFWWQGPDGKRVLFWYARHYLEMQIFFGLPPQTAVAHQTLPIFLAPYERLTYRASSVLMFGAQQENTELNPTQAAFAGEWNGQYAFPRLEYAGFAEAMKKIAAEAGNDLPVVSGDGGPYWEDGIAADARYAAMERQAETRAPAAEQLATLAATLNPRLSADKHALDGMWHDMLLADEHTFNSHDAFTDPTSDETLHQTAFKQLTVTDATASADFIARQAMAEISELIPVGKGNVVVFNTLNWKRTDPVLFDLPHGQVLMDSVSGKPVVVEILGHEQSLDHVRFVARDVPANGYKVYRLLRAHEDKGDRAEGDAESTVLDGRFYRVTLDAASGSIRSIWDKELKRELVDQANKYRFAQCLYVSGGDQLPNTLLRYRLVTNAPPLTISGSSGGRIVLTTRTPDGWLAMLESSGPHTPKIETEIRVPDDKKAIEIVEELDKEYVRAREGVYFAFPFAMDHPQFRYEIQSGVVDPAKTMYPGAGHTWFSAQHWAAVEQGGVAAAVMPLDAGLITLGDIHHGEWPDHFGDRPGNIFSWVMNNYWSTNYAAGQSGHFRFRYVVTSAPSIDAPALSRLGWEEATALETNDVTAQDKQAGETHGSISGTEASFLRIDDPAVVLEAWKPAEDGRGVVMRFLDTGGAQRTIHVEVPAMTLREVRRTDAVERDKEALPLAGEHGFSFTIGPHEFVTLRLLR